MILSIATFTVVLLHLLECTAAAAANTKTHTNTLSSLSNILKKSIACTSVAMCALITPNLSDAATEKAQSIQDITVSYQAEKVPMKTLLGKKATLIMNFAGECDLPQDGNPQCAAIEALYETFEPKGLNIIMFPTEQFRDRSQLGDAPPEIEIRENMQKRFKWTFPIVDLVEVNGGNTAPVYKAMKEVKGISRSDLKKIDWNFEKFLVDKDGIPVRRYRPSVMPEKLYDDIESLVEKGVLKPVKKVQLGAV